MMNLGNKNVGFIGGGNMAKAIVEGLLKKGVLNPFQIYVSAPSKSTLDSWKPLKVHTSHNNGEIIDSCEVIFLAFKPYQMDKALQDVKLTVNNEKLFISILVGVSCNTIMTRLEALNLTSCRLIRVMPNVAVATGEGCSVISRDKNATGEDVKVARILFSALGICEEVPENLMESVAAVIGSGPAYIFLAIESIADGAVKHGMPRELALTLAAQTALGASKLVLETKKHPGQLKDEVCSPGGTTICGVHELEKGQLRATFMNAVEAAVKRAEEIKNFNYE